TLGDPVMAAFSGLVFGCAKHVPVLMAGGTQMCSILSILKALDPKTLDRLAIGTTRWIVSDKTSDIRGMVSQIADVPILAANISFEKSRFSGLREYERGVVKEGVGAGGAVITAVATKGVAVSVVSKEVEYGV
ncbi:MAG: TIGR00303 family protein, partial [Nitrososphaerota archaeon]